MSGPFTRAGGLASTRRELIDRVKHDALLRILRGNLEIARAGDVADDRVIVEVERAGVAGARGVALNPGFREHQHLRIAGDVQRAQNRTQITAALVMGQRHDPACEGAAQLRHCVMRRLGRVADGGVLVEHAGKWRLHRLLCPCRPDRTKVGDAADPEARCRGDRAHARMLEQPGRALPRNPRTAASVKDRRDPAH